MNQSHRPNPACVARPHGTPPLINPIDWSSQFRIPIQMPKKSLKSLTDHIPYITFVDVPILNEREPEPEDDYTDPDDPDPDIPDPPYTDPPDPDNPDHGNVACAPPIASQHVCLRQHKSLHGISSALICTTDSAVAQPPVTCWYTFTVTKICTSTLICDTN